MAPMHVRNACQCRMMKSKSAPWKGWESEIPLDSHLPIRNGLCRLADLLPSERRSHHTTGTNCNQVAATFGVLGGNEYPSRFEQLGFFVSTLFWRQMTHTYQSGNERYTIAPIQAHGHRLYVVTWHSWGLGTVRLTSLGTPANEGHAVPFFRDAVRGVFKHAQLIGIARPVEIA